ncbi:MAG: type I methionyl aminopeptidase [Candidatus Taylorbacteria bacterium RIFCSPLOWO2_02_FULL_43_11]|uniref:Methionine aminopeptidase n=1 Tax=Candidatus Taylorbacteria bacterium RIFCSPHIGHO2_02_FULL_43_32b TaxID=1802306 RepID=A0A1G2MJW6_9BACT|nr:MAG: type I methionyl aminopeptidase [Candidatus Taylorbacteria bacterium RIFCSPHIGHO2_01_FULL_43_47]OHA23311.1 MAG: type I methionyl aminopeptidase [Candidatus Taylorbacteria bacterium RIFCSPHIGHO2_02_FULL_43_32b]OHA30179.1 MAG: type I methionyl aminopeptidase [Candidatus Taylorbacteria bacterium RIFCSPLOWO2_01_FULL_43_44]OHA36012.1 MAG: type I methionyl aminopeptidase [Candidatus Taylorbacteria bacterium RIFCSPLOWO2_02_FULL_43_11]
MSIRLKTDKEIEVLREGGRHLAELLKLLSDKAVPGVSSADLDKVAIEFIKGKGDKPAFLGYKGKYDKEAYPAVICVSVNDEVVHGEPTRSPRIFKEGDIVGIDAGIIHAGLYTDSAVTVPIGKIKKDVAKLLKVTRKALEIGIEAAKIGNTTGDIGYAIEKYVKPFKFGIIRELAGHGVGYAVHEDPFVPNYGKEGGGVKLEPGLVIAIEPMLNLGSEKIYLAEDGHTYKTEDGQFSAHFEHTIAVTESGPKVLTSL